ncbi:hypothetical protein CXB77_06015 (plasmid) [Chromatium okenii]|uniref:Uncharacterized protein n=2 Tax=Chromatium okenii TaxID=61644 RepID=A0A2S7XSP7_9GAMM|nr:hypothetical protein CXB77_06015 [Chromatium okenii]
MTRALPNPPSILSIARSPEATRRNVVADSILSRWGFDKNRHPSAAHLDAVGAAELALVADGEYEAADSDRIYPNDDPVVVSRLGERSKRFNRALNSKDFVSALNDAASIFVTNPAGYDLSHREWCAQTQLVDFRPAATFQVMPLELKKLPSNPFEANQLDRQIVTVEGNDLEVQTVGGFVTFSRQLLKNNRFDLLAETIKSLTAACYRAERNAVLKILLDDDSIEAPEKRLFNSENDAPSIIASGPTFLNTKMRFSPNLPALPLDSELLDYLERRDLRLLSEQNQPTRSYPPHLTKLRQLGIRPSGPDRRRNWADET